MGDETIPEVYLRVDQNTIPSKAQVAQRLNEDMRTREKGELESELVPIERWVARCDLRVMEL